MRMFLRSGQDNDIANLVSGMYHQSNYLIINDMLDIPWMCIYLIIKFWNYCDSDCVLQFHKFMEKLKKKHKIACSTTWIDIKQKDTYKIAIKFGEYRIVNLYPRFGTFSIIDANTKKILQNRLIIKTSCGTKKWIIPTKHHNKPFRVILQLFYSKSCKTCKKSPSYIKIFIFHSGLDLIGGFVTSLNVPNSLFESDESIEIITWQGKIHSQGMSDFYKCFCYGWKLENEEHWRNKLLI